MSIQNGLNIGPGSNTIIQQHKKIHTGLIDTDVHEMIPSWNDLVPYLEEQWRPYITDYGWVPEKRHSFRQVRKGNVQRMDAIPEGGGPAGSSYPLMREQLLDKYNLDYAILSGLTFIANDHSWFEFAAARASAYNDWLVENWLDKDPRLLGSIQIAADPVTAVREIERMASHPQMVQVLLAIGDFSWGEPYYHPIFEAADRHNLVVFMHLGTSIVASGGGDMRYYWAWRSALPQAFMTQVISMITNGVFDKYPNLRIVLAEGGYEWAPFLMWRMDAAWKGLRQETPWVKRKPSDYFKDNMRFTTQPWHDLEMRHFLQIVDMMGSDKMLLFSTDYPHWDFDDPTKLFQTGISEDLKRKIFFENAREWYQL